MKSIDRKTWEKLQRQNRIIDISQELFFQKGYEATTMEDIARAAQYNQRTIYLYFKDKQELFLAVVLRGLRLLNEMLKEASNNSRPGKTKVHELGKAYFDFFMKHPDYFDLIMVYESKNCVYYKNDGEHEYGHYKTECRKAADECSEIITVAIQDGIENKSIRTSLTSKQVMLILWGQILGIMQIILMRKSHFEETYEISHEKLFFRFMDLIERALLIEI
ncbi:MAG: TetR/AcrR family transcriptional regulator [Deltaproteobacteria bacterium]|nr:TetR/AcrR family transcriptional regulator [Deltaproteobacteria bacterium]